MLVVGVDEAQRHHNDGVGVALASQRVAEGASARVGGHEALELAVLPDLVGLGQLQLHRGHLPDGRLLLHNAKALAKASDVGLGEVAEAERRDRDVVHSPEARAQLAHHGLRDCALHQRVERPRVDLDDPEG